MAEIKGTNVASKIVPYTTSDNYATHDEEYGRGGFRTVDSVSAMNAIPSDRRKEGMLVYVKNDKYYKLNSSNTFVDAGILGGGSNEVYFVDYNKLNFTSILDGDTFTDGDEEEISNIIDAADSKRIIYYCGIGQNPFIYGTLDFSLNIINGLITFVVPYEDYVRIYIVNVITRTWTVKEIDAGGSGGSGTSNIKILNTPELFYTRRNKMVSLNSHDIEVIKSLFNNGYKNTTVFYAGAPNGDIGICPVNIYSNNFANATNLGDTGTIYMSIIQDVGTIVTDNLDIYDDGVCQTVGMSASTTSGNFTSGRSLSLNGYEKFNDGLMVQWGQSTASSAGVVSIYLPTSFLNTSYVITSSIFLNKSATTSGVYSTVIQQRFTSYFSMDIRYTTGKPYCVQEPFCWIAIGRWK